MEYTANIFSYEEILHTLLLQTNLEDLVNFSSITKLTRKVVNNNAFLKCLWDKLLIKETYKKPFTSLWHFSRRLAHYSRAYLLYPLLKEKSRHFNDKVIDVKYYLKLWQNGSNTNGLRSYQDINGSLLDMDYIFDVMEENQLQDVKIYLACYLVSKDFNHFKRICRMFGYILTYRNLLSFRDLPLEPSILRIKRVTDKELRDSIENFTIIEEDLLLALSSCDSTKVDLLRQILDHITPSILEKISPKKIGWFLDVAIPKKAEVLEKLLEISSLSIEEYFKDRHIHHQLSEEIQEYLLSKLSDIDKYKNIASSSYIYYNEILIESGVFGIKNSTFCQQPLDILRVYLSNDKEKKSFENILCDACRNSRKDIVQWLFFYYPGLAKELDWCNQVNSIGRSDMNLYFTSFLISQYVSVEGNTLESWMEMVEISQIQDLYPKITYDDILEPW